MKTYLDSHLSAVLKGQPNPNANAHIAHLAALVRQGVKGAFETIMQQLKPLLIALANELEPEDPGDICSELYQAILRKKNIITYIKNDIRTKYRSLWRGQKRQRQGVAHLTLIQTMEEEATSDPERFLPGEISILLKYLDPDDRALWLGVSEERSLPQLAEELGWSVSKTEKRWQELVAKVKSTLDDDSK